MFHQLKSLFLRFYARHYQVTSRGFPLRNSKGHLVGNVDKINISYQSITLHGWCHAERVTFVTNGGGATSMRPQAHRPDVSRTYGGSPDVGFCLTEAAGNGRYTLDVNRTQSDMRPLHIKPLSKSRKIGAQILVMLRFIMALCQALPATIRWWVFRDFSARQRVKAMMGFEVATSNLALDPKLLRNLVSDRPPPLSTTRITIILPIYNAFDLLPEVLSRVVQNTDTPWRLILIEDCSADAHLRPWLRQWVKVLEQAGLDQIELIENPCNLGFIRSVNKGLERAETYGDHVVLLNSDAFVPKDWASRLIAPIVADSGVASATPMSNDAEIYSAPFICKQMTLQAGQADEMDQIARTLPEAPGEDSMPTGVGFCMAMNIAYLKRLPQFDTVFGRGYGEEVDWCQKARVLKGRHVAVPNLFVEHRGGASFGSAEKQALVAKNNGLISKRHTGYDVEVQAFIKNDPLLTQRMVLAVAWAAQQAGERSLPIYLAHSLGGGANLYLEHRMRADWETDGLPAIVIRVGGGLRWQIEVVAGPSRCQGALDEFQDVQSLLGPVKQRKIVYSCGVGDRAPMSLPKHLTSLKASEQCQLEMLVHDYFMISPDYTLLDEVGVFEWPRKKEALNAQLSATHQKWQTAWAYLIKEANHICVFSQSSRDILLASYPFARSKTLVQPHALLTEVPYLYKPCDPGQKRVVAVLGNIGFHKGAEVLRDLAPLLEWRQDISLMVLGSLDPAYQLPKNVHVHGGYDLTCLADLVRRYQITDWLIPSIWPETFSYTTHEALATGLPTYAFDIGAQGEAVRRCENGRAITYSDGKNLANKAFTALAQASDARANRPAEMVAGLS